MDMRAESCIREQEQLASARSIWESHWGEIAQRVRPDHNAFTQIDRPAGEKRNQRVFDSTAILALDKFVAAVISMSFPATQRYQKLTVRDDALADDVAVRRYFDQKTDILFRARYAPRSNFQAQSYEVVADIGTFGTGIMFTDDDLGKGIRYRSLPLSECYIGDDAYGTINTLIRKFQWTAKQSAEKFGANRLPDGVARCLEKEPNKKFWWIHCVRPNPDKKRRAATWHGMDYWSCYICLDEGRSIVDEGGYRVFPFAVPRFSTAPGEIYGRSPAMKCLPDINMVNEMEKTNIRSAQIAVSPPLLLSDDGALQAFQNVPNALNYGYWDSSSGKPLIAPLENKARVELGLDMTNQKREAINDAFFVTLFRILVEEPNITATEAMLRAQEKGQLLAPTMGRTQSEFIGKITRREDDILEHAGAFPPMPDKLARYFADGGDYDVDYESPLNLAQKAGEGIAIMNTLNAIAPLAQIDPSVMMRFDLDKAAEQLAKINGVPASILLSDDEVTARKEQAASAAQAKQLLAAAPVAAGAARDFAQASALAGSAGGQVVSDLGLPA